MPRSWRPLRVLDLIPVVYTRELQDALDDRKKLARGLSLQTAGKIKLEFDSLTKGTVSIEDSYDEALNIPYILEKIRAAETEQYSAVVIDCFGDPGLEAARELVRIPVVGPAQSASHLAAQLAPRFSIINTVPEFAHIDHELMIKYGLTQQLASVVTVDIPVLALESQRRRTVYAMVRAAEKAVRQDGAQAIVLGCTGMSSLVAAMETRLVAKGLHVPIVEPLRAAVYTAVALVLADLTHSKQAFMPPRAKRRVIASS